MFLHSDAASILLWHRDCTESMRVFVNGSLHPRAAEHLPRTWYCENCLFYPTDIAQHCYLLLPLSVGCCLRFLVLLAHIEKTLQSGQSQECSSDSAVHIQILTIGGIWQDPTTCIKKHLRFLPIVHLHPLTNVSIGQWIHSIALFNKFGHIYSLTYHCHWQCWVWVSFDVSAVAQQAVSKTLNIEYFKTTRAKPKGVLQVCLCWA